MPKQEEDSRIHLGSISDPSRIHLGYLDGIRAIAALWVVLAHTWISQYSLRTYHGVLGAFTNWLPYVHYAVDIFIVLSGFVLMLPVARHGMTLRGGAISFFLRRAKRILPPYYAALLLAILVNAIVPYTGYSSLHPPCMILLYHALLLSDMPFPGGNVFNYAFWSVALEWKIYFLFPSIVWLVRKAGLWPTLLLSGFASYGTHFFLAQHFSSWALYRTWYVFLFTLGVCASAAITKYQGDIRRLQWWIVALLGASTVALALLIYLWPIKATAMPQSYTNHELHHPYQDAAVGVVTACLLMLLSGTRTHESSPAAVLRRLLGSRPLVAVGTFSYSLYLVHLPLVTVFAGELLHTGIGLHGRTMMMFLVGVPAVTGFSYLFFLAFERPFLTSRRQETPAEVARDAALSPAP